MSWQEWRAGAAGGLKVMLSQEERRRHQRAHGHRWPSVARSAHGSGGTRMAESRTTPTARRFVAEIPYDAEFEALRVSLPGPIAPRGHALAR